MIKHSAKLIGEIDHPSRVAFHRGRPRRYSWFRKRIIRPKMLLGSFCHLGLGSAVGFYAHQPAKGLAPA
jgi:hypothetical protein